VTDWGVFSSSLLWFVWFFRGFGFAQSSSFFFYFFFSSISSYCLKRRREYL